VNYFKKWNGRNKFKFLPKFKDIRWPEIPIHYWCWQREWGKNPIGNLDKNNHWVDLNLLSIKITSINQTFPNGTGTIWNKSIFGRKRKIKIRGSAISADA